MDKIINGARVREMAAQANMSYGRIAKDQHVDPTLIHMFMDVNKITFASQSKFSKAAHNKKSPVSDSLDLVKVLELADKPGSTLKSMAAELHVAYTTIRSFTIRYHISVDNRVPLSRNRANLLKLDDIRTKAAVDGASYYSIAKASNVSIQTVARFMKKHDITLTSPCMRSVLAKKQMARQVDLSKNSDIPNDTSDRVSIASLVDS